MIKDQLKQIITDTVTRDGLTETGIKGVRFFRATDAVPCTPAVYEPCVVAIVSGVKEVVLDGHRHVYDHETYMCCPISLPVQAGTPLASKDNPLLGVILSLDTQMLAELTLDMDRAAGVIRAPSQGPLPTGFKIAPWDDGFSQAMARLVAVTTDPVDAAVLGQGRLREVFHAILKGQAGEFVRRAFGTGNEIAQAIAHLSDSLDDAITIDDLATKVGMSRAVFHRKFKQATTMSPIQFVKSMRLNNAAMKIAGGMTVNAAALDVGYVSTSQFSRDFRRMYGQSPRQWGQSAQLPMGLT